MSKGALQKLHKNVARAPQEFCLLFFFSKEIGKKSSKIPKELPFDIRCARRYNQCSRGE
jgi:hypothetical protein